MAQFGGQKTPPPWATQFTAAAVSQPGPLGVQQPSLLGASPTIYTQSALAAAGLSTPSQANYQLSQTAALQQHAAAAAAAAALQQQYSQPQQIYSVQQQLQQPQQTLITQPAVALPTSLALSTPQQTAQITVSYPTPRSSQQQSQPQKQRVFTGVVTKLHETFGFVDEDVFFQLTAVKGKSPQVGDRVLVEATYNPNMPFKWNAQRIQTLPNQNPAQAQTLMKNPTAVMAPVAQQPAFGVQTQPPPQAQTLLQAQISAASLNPLLQAQPSQLLQQQQPKEEDDKDDGDAKEICTPTHWSKLDPKIMKVNDLRKELESRTLSSKGLKSQLIARLTKQLRVEEQKEEQKEQEKCEKEEEEEEERKSEDDKEEEERKRQEEVERQRREKRYILPEEPAIIVHPNWSAKNGKFDCSIMSLSVLLDYRIEDNKEHSFEVSLFAELFNEMLQRDFGVRIYKELLTLPEKEEKRDKKIKKEDRRDKKDDKDDDEEPKLKRRKSSDEKLRSEERDDRKRDDRKRDDYRDDEEIDDDIQEDYEPIGAEEDDGDYEDREDDDDDSSTKDKREDKRENRYSKECLSKDKEKEKKLMVTVNKDLLMAFVYFDQSHCGYLLDKDLEEIIYTLGLHLSRAQVKKLLSKVLLKESLCYRKFTDTCTDDGSHEETDICNEDILGNRLLLPSKIARSGVSSVEENGGLIVYNGAMVDVGSLLQKLEKSEKARTELEQRLQALQSKTEVDEKTISQLEASNKSLSGELKETKSDLSHLRESLKSLEDTNCQYEDQLTKTIRELSATMEGIQTVLSRNPLASEDQKSKENGSSF